MSKILTQQFILRILIYACEINTQDVLGVLRTPENLAKRFC